MKVNKITEKYINLENGKKIENTKNKPYEFQENKKSAETPVNPSYWQNITFKGNKPKNPIERYDKNVSFPWGPQGYFILSKTDITEDDLNKVSEMIEDGYLAPEAYNLMTDRYDSFDGQGEEHLKLINTLYGFYQNKEKDKCEYFNNIVLSTKTRASDEIIVTTKKENEKIMELLNENSPVKKELAKLTYKVKEHYGSEVYKDLAEFDSAANIIDEENLAEISKRTEEYLAEEDFNAGIFGIFELFGKVNSYINPKTKKYDIKLFDLANSLKAQYQDDFEWHYLHDMNLVFGNVISDFADKNTGMIDKKAVDFVKEYFFDEYSKHPCNHLPNNVYKKYMLKGMLKALKDSKGSFRDENMEAFKRVYESDKKDLFLNVAQNPFVAPTDISTLEAIKNKKGVIEKENLDFIMSNVDKFKTTEELINFATANKKLGHNETIKLLDELTEMFDSEKTALSAINIFAQNAYDKKGKRIENPFNVFNEIGHIVKDAKIYPRFFEFALNNKNLVLKLYEKQGTFSTNDIESLCKMTYPDMFGEEYSFDCFDNVDKYVDKKLNIDEYRIISDVYNRTFYEGDCIKTNNDSILIKPKHLFEIYKHSNIRYEEAKNRQEYVDDEMSEYAEFLSGYSFVSQFDYDKRKRMIETFTNMMLDKNIAKDNEFRFLSEFINKLKAHSEEPNSILEVDEASKREFLTSVLGSKKEEGEIYTPFEKTIINAKEIFEDMTGGLPLKYTRTMFLDDISSLCDTDEKKEIFFKKTGIKPCVKDGLITGYEGIIKLDNFNKEDEFEKSLYDTCHKFLYENEVQTKDENLNKELNKIIKASPEFINIIGKKHHTKDSKTFDIESLLTLSKAISSKEYQNLKNQDKLMLKTAVLFGEISKEERSKNNYGTELSALTARNISRKFFKNEKTINRLYDIICGRNIPKMYEETSAYSVVSKYIPRPNDFDIQKIIIKANDSEKPTCKNQMIDKLQKATDKMYSTGNVLLTDYPVQQGKLDALKKDCKGHKCTVINLNEIQDDADMGEYGFEKGKKKKDLYMLVHMISDVKFIDNLKKLAKSTNDGILSASLITPDKSNTLSEYMRTIGVLLSVENNNIINTSKFDTNSGFVKDEETAYDLIYVRDQLRKDCKKQILCNLGFNKYDVSNTEYANFYKKILAGKTSFNQIVDSKKYKLGDKFFTGDKLKKAITEYQNSLLADNEYSPNNEIIVKSPKIEALVARAKIPEEVYEGLFAYAEKENLPVILI